jgi:NAD(P)-dependent dehydrogenase (short-subunit alcohol dehydrogenase family)
MPLMSNILITGANRGIGLSFAKQYADDGWRVYATCRSPESATDLKALEDEQVSVHALDVTDAGSIASLRNDLSNVDFDVLLNNAGYLGPEPQGLYESDDELWLQQFRVNTLAPLRMTEAFLENVKRSKRKQIFNISSILASNGNAFGGYYPYRATKGGLNAITKNLAIDLEDRGITVAVFHPGWVRTEMGGPTADLSADESAAALRTIFEKMTPADSGKYYNFTGKELPW